MIIQKKDFITLIDLNHIAINCYDICKERFGEYSNIFKGFVFNFEGYINFCSYQTVIKQKFYEKAVEKIKENISRSQKTIFIPNKDFIEEIVLKEILIYEVKDEYNKFLSTVNFVKKVYEKNIDRFDFIKTFYNMEQNDYVELFKLFLMLVYEFYKVRKHDINHATLKAFEIMDMLFDNSWNYLFVKEKNQVYIDFLNKNVYNYIIHKDTFFIEFNFKALKQRYIKYFITKIKNTIINYS